MHTMRIRKLLKKAQCAECDDADQDTEEGLEEAFVSTKQGLVLGCEMEISASMMRCSTCCCADGLVKQEVSSSLTRSGTPELKGHCKTWFTGIDGAVRSLILSTQRILSVLADVKSACFRTPKELEKLLYPKGKSQASTKTTVLSKVGGLFRRRKKND